MGAQHPPQFPMQGGPTISWALAEEIYRVYAAVFPGSASSQSLTEIASRGGFGWAEVTALAKEYRRKFKQLPDGWSA